VPETELNENPWVPSDPLWQHLTMFLVKEAPSTQFPSEGDKRTLMSDVSRTLHHTPLPFADFHLYPFAIVDHIGFPEL
jgi:hypothetical protein